MKATPKGLIKRVLRRGGTPASVMVQPTTPRTRADIIAEFRASTRQVPMVVAIENIVSPTPTVPTIADSDEFMTLFTMIDKGQGGAKGVQASMRRKAMDAMIRMAESGDPYLGEIIADAGAMGAEPLRSALMTLATLENTHRLTLVRS